MFLFLFVGGGGGGGHLDAKSKMAAKNNKYTPGTHWSPDKNDACKASKYTVVKYHVCMIESY